MFTGLIEEQGIIRDCKVSREGTELTVECRVVSEGVKSGSSICVNGACLSVTSYGKDYIKLQVSNETLRVTTLGTLKTGSSVNLERALCLNQRLDGHIVTGHVDCKGVLKNRQKDGFSEKLSFSLPMEFSKYIIYKGSIAINGVSLTIASVNGNEFSVELIPDTLKKVNLSELKTGDSVNIETDLFAKYTEKIYNSRNERNNINYDFLAGNGFV